MIPLQLEKLKTNITSPFRLQGLLPSAQAFIITGYLRAHNENLLVIAPDAAEAEKLADDIAFFLGGKEDVIFLPQWEILPYEPFSPHMEVSAERNRALKSLAMREAGPLVCVTTLAALMHKCPPEEAITRNSFKLEKGGEVEIESLKTFLDQTGYTFYDPVEEPGFYAFRGGLLDLFPPSETSPLRIEFFGDEVESIRYFDFETQRSLKRLDEVEIFPVREAGYGGIDITNLFEKLSALEVRHSASLDELRRKFEDCRFFPAMELYLPYFFRKSATALDYLPSPIAVVECEPERIKERQELFLSEIEEGYAGAIQRNEYYPSPEELYLDAGKLELFIKDRLKLQLAEISTEEENENCRTLLTIEPQRYRGASSRFIYDCRQQLSRGGSPLVLVRSHESADRVEKLFSEEDIGIKRLDSDEVAGLAEMLFEENGNGPSLMVAVGGLSTGFASEQLGLAVTTEEEIFGRHHVAGRHRAARKETVFATDFSDVAPGDFVVHRDHGRGIYHGTRFVSADRTSDEYLELEYADDQRLFLPISSVYLLEKYSGAGGPKPHLDHLGGKSWQKTRAKVKKGIMKMASELLDIYAKRQSGSAYRFSTKDSFNAEFMETFEFIETPDQAAAIKDVFRDMTSEKPMDRLICGDVGYGKTEIAMRAAFCAAVEGKQTAVLAPTTLLVNQHYQVFKDRMERFGVIVEILSRFISKVKQKEILKRLEQGKVDIIIGTHRLLQKDVNFSDLGLVIVDEEQQFGVTHKEKLKKLRATVDVLTLAATPIPRTLYMSLSGIRDISIINTPPPGRLSIKTLIRRMGDEVITEAVNREMSRGGQVFLVHNSVETIERMHRYLKTLLPRARIAVAHGQMRGSELEEVMEKFVKHRLDILLCTTIIEAGLDIPNANTIIINRADKFGLAQLYQLRGRVGRDRHRAYAYLMVPANIPPLARKRIKAIEELSELGSGFRLAARDMEIRGAGNLLGSQQSGHLAAVGFETYCRMLQEAVEEIKTGKAAMTVDTQLDLDFTGKLEESYIPVLEQRMNYYNRLYRASSTDEIRQISDELADRYGPLHEKAVKLVDAMVLRLAGSMLGIEKLGLNGVELTLTFAPESERVVEVTTAAGNRFPGGTKPAGERTLSVDITPLAADRVKGVCQFLEEMIPAE